jgi:hypothetical protein
MDKIAYRGFKGLASKSDTDNIYGSSLIVTTGASLIVKAGVSLIVKARVTLIVKTGVIKISARRSSRYLLKLDE